MHPSPSQSYLWSRRSLMDVFGGLIPVSTQLTVSPGRHPQGDGQFLGVLCFQATAAEPSRP